MRRLSLSTISHAHQTFKRWFPETPIEYSIPLSEHLQVPLILKCDQFQPSGSSVLRGIYYVVSEIKETERKQGLALYNGGHQAIALAYVCQLLGISCTLYIPSKTPLWIQQKCQEYHASIEHPKNSDDISEILWAEQESARRGFYFITPHTSDLFLAAIGGSLAKEILKQIPQIKNLILPLHQAEIFGGLAFFLKKKFPDLTFIVTDSTVPKDILSRKGSDLIKKENPLLFTVSDAEILEARKWFLSHHQHHLTTEAATVIAACLHPQLPKLEGTTTAILFEKSFDEEALKNLLSS